MSVILQALCRHCGQISEIHQIWSLSQRAEIGECLENVIALNNVVMLTFMLILTSFPSIKTI